MIAAPPSPEFFEDTRTDPGPPAGPINHPTGSNDSPFSGIVRPPPPPWMPQTQWDLTTVETRALIDPFTADAPFGEAGDSNGRADCAFRPVLISACELADPCSFDASDPTFRISPEMQPYRDDPDTIKAPGTQFWVQTRYPIDVIVEGDAWRDGDMFQVVQANTAPVTVQAEAGELLHRADLSMTAGPGSVITLSYFNDRWVMWGDLTKPSRIPLGPYAWAVLADLPTCYYRLADDGTDGIAEDLVGGPPGEYFGNVQFQNMNLLPGAVGQAPLFDGNSGVRIPDNPATRLGDAPMSAEIWLRPTAPLAGSGRVAMIDSGPTGLLTGQLPYRIFYHPNGVALAIVFVGPVGVPDGPGASVGASTHFVAVREPGLLKIYGDGALKYSGTATGTGSVGLQGVVLATAERYSDAAGARGWTGQLQEFALYDYPLTADQVSAHFQTGMYGS